MGDAMWFEVSSEIFAIRCSCVERLKFEVEYGLKRGTTENSYLIKGQSRDTTVLIDIPSQPFSTSFLLALQKVVAAKRIGRIFLTHVQPESISVLESLIRLINPDGSNPVEIYASAAAVRLLQASLDEDGMESDLHGKYELKTIQVTESMKISDQMEFEFVRTATPRWPDMLTIYIPQRKLLFSSKLFSAHVAPQLAEVKETAFDVGGWQTYGNDWWYFFETMLAPSLSQVRKALDMLSISAVSSVFALPAIQDWLSQLLSLVSPSKEREEERSVQRLLVGICPLHGPIIKNALNELVENYGQWIQEQTAIKGNVAVFYASAYGNTAALAQAISHGINKTGLGVNTFNLEICEPSDVEEAINEADGFVIGSPTLGGHMPTQVQTALGTIVRTSRAKELPCGVFGSFGWSGEAVDELQQRLRDGGFQFGFDPIKIKMKPTAKDLQVCEESGTDLAQAVEKKLKKRDKQVISVTRSRTASGAAQAVGRIVGSLCVISGKDGDVESGMLASWVSQASFNPPGLTVAVKRDRAVENVLLVGNRFNVNILAEGKEKEVVKHMLKPFKPGENRFEGIIAEVCEETDCVVIHNAVSYLECTVKERMEAGDHWIVYATVEGGSVLDKDDLSAVHHRKVGTNY